MRNEQAATQYVIRELGKHKHKNDIVEKLCHDQEMSWREAQAFVGKIESEHSNKITLRQSPMFIIVGLLILVGGIGISVWIGMRTFVNHENIIFLSMPFPYSGNLAIAGTAITMVVSGLIGIFTPLAKVKRS